MWGVLGDVGAKVVAEDLVDWTARTLKNFGAGEEVQYYSSSESCMNAIFEWITSAPDVTLITKPIFCTYNGSINIESISGELYGGAFLLTGFKNTTDNGSIYASIIAYSYYKERPLLVSIIENDEWKKRFERVLTKYDLNFLTANLMFNNTNLNALTKSGIYWVGISEGLNNSTYNYPGDAINGWLQVITTPIEGGFYLIKQIFYRYGSQATRFSTGRHIYVRTFYPDGTDWSVWTRLITDTDFIPIQIYGGRDNETFRSVLKDAMSGGDLVKFIAFHTVSDNPFSFNEGYAIAFHSWLHTESNNITLIAIPVNGGKVESAIINTN